VEVLHGLTADRCGIVASRNEERTTPGLSRRAATKLLGSAVGLACALGLTRKSNASRFSAAMHFVVDGEKSVALDLPVEIEEALTNKSVVEILTQVNGNLYRANFKVEIE
jgi:hypothetical protein